MNLKKDVKGCFRPIRDITYTLFGFVYDFWRFYKYAGWRGCLKDSDKRNYKSVKIYHRLEKSLSYKKRNENSGWGAVEDFIYLHRKGKKKKDAYLFHEKVGVNVVKKFLEASDDEEKKYSYVKHLAASEANCEHGGVIKIASDDLKKGMLDDPEAFFNSRYSVRDFNSQEVSAGLVKRAISLAMKTPSVCNRQAWKVYHLYERDSIDRALLLQNGNKGFGHEIPCLLIIAADLKAFDTFGERYQPYIDGGMFSMSLVMALHSLGLSTCCLNWSKGPLEDQKFRKLIDIKNSHTILMMLAVGNASDTLKVCYSARRPIEQVYEAIS